MLSKLEKWFGRASDAPAPQSAERGRDGDGRGRQDRRRQNVHVINGLEFSGSLIYRARRCADDDGVSVFQVIRTAVERYLKERGV